MVSLSTYIWGRLQPSLSVRETYSWISWYSNKKDEKYTHYREPQTHQLKWAGQSSPIESNLSWQRSNNLVSNSGDPVFTQTDSREGQTARSAQDRMQANSCLRPFSAFLLLVVLPGSFSSSLLPGDRVELFARAVHSLIPGHGAWSEAGKIVVLHYFSDPRCCSWRTPT